MAGSGDMTREERLAARLRENLRRRKEQARALATAPSGDSETPGQFPPDSGPPLSKQPPSR